MKINTKKSNVIAWLSYFAVASLFVFLTLENQRTMAAPTIDFSAYIIGQNNQEITDQNLSITFSLYTSETGDAGRVWQETKTVPVQNGIIKTQLGDQTPFPNFLDLTNNQYYLGIKVGNSSEGTPRRRISISPFSINSLNAVNAMNAQNAADSQALTGAVIGTNAGNIPVLGTGGRLTARMLPTNITTLGTVTTGTWEADTITNDYIETDLTGKTYNGLDFSTTNNGFTITNGSYGLTLNGSSAIDQSLATFSTPSFAGLRLSEMSVNGNNYVGFEAPASIVTDLTWTLPAADGTPNQVLTTDGSGVLSWSTTSSTSYTASAADNLLKLNGTEFSIKQGTMGDGKLCSYDATEGLVCNTSASAGGAEYSAGSGLYLSGGTEFRLGGTITENTNFNVYGSSAARNVRFYNSNTTSEIFFISGSNARVGIGTTAPATALDINGVVTATGGNSTNWNAGYTNRITGVTDSVTGLDFSLGANSITLGLTSGYVIPTTTDQTNWNTAYTGTHNAVTLNTSSHDYLSLSTQQITLGTIDISDDTNLGVGGTMLQISGDTISMKEGTLTNGRLCTYVAGTGLVCDTTSSSVGHTPVTIGSPANGLTVDGSQVVSLGLASGSTTGALSSSDWTTFNSKQAAGSYLTALTGEVTATGPGSASATVSNAAVIGKVLTGFSAGAGTVTASDSILSAIQKLAGSSGGGVTSVGLAMPSELTVTNSPVTGTGTLTAAWASQNANRVFASPNGSSGTPTFRALVDNDIPDTITLSNLTQITTRDHGSLTGLTDDDHTIYMLLAGRAGGQALTGGSGAGDNLTLVSTSDGTKGKIIFGTSGYDEVNNRLGIGTTAPGQKLSINGNLGIIEGGAAPQYYTVFQGGDQNSNVTYTLPSGTGSAGQVLKIDSSSNLYWGSVEGGSGGIGTVTSVASGDGLTGGPITETGTLSVNLLSTGSTSPTTSSYSGMEFVGGQLSLLHGCANTQSLSWNSSTQKWVCASISGMGGLTGFGTAGYVSYWDSESTIGNSVVYQTGGKIGIGTTAPATALEVGGIITATGGISTNWNTAYSWGNHASAGYAVLNNLATVATTGNYSDLSGAPVMNDYATILYVDSNYTKTSNLATVATSGSYSDLSGRPTNLSQFNNDAGFITSYTETDPIFGASSAYGITAANITNWNTAYTGTHNAVTLNTSSHDYLSLSTQQITLGTIDISDDTNLGVGGTMLQISGDTISMKEGTLTNGRICTYVEGTGLVCDTTAGSVGVNYWQRNGSYLAPATIGDYVGIGTTAPTTALDVNGVITATGGNSTNWNSAYSAMHNAVTLNTSAHSYLTLSTQQITLGQIDISSDTNLGVGGTMLQISGDNISLKEGTLTNGKICTYVTGTGLVCNTDSGAVGVNYWQRNSTFISPAAIGDYVGIGLTNPTALLTLAASNTTRASLNILSGIAPSSPNDGDFWYDGTHLYFRNSSDNKDLLSPGGSFQASDATLTSLSALGTAADKIAYTTGVDTWAETTLTAFGRTLIDDSDAATARTTLGLSSMATATESNYALLAGRGGGQTLIGGTGPSDQLVLQATSGNATTGIGMQFNVGNNGATKALTILNSGYIGIGTTSPSYAFDLRGVVTGSSYVNYIKTTSTANAYDQQLFGTVIDAAFSLGSYNGVHKNALTVLGGTLAIGSTAPEFALLDVSGDAPINANVGNPIGVNIHPTLKAQFWSDIAKGLVVNPTFNNNSKSIDYAYGIVSTVNFSGGNNIAGYFSASLGSGNYGLLVQDGNVGIGYTFPGSKLTVSGGLAVGTTSPSSIYLTAQAPDGGALFEGRVGIGTTNPAALLTLAGSSTTRASLNIASGTAPSSPNAGDIWYDGSNLYFRNGSTSTSITAGLLPSATIAGQTVYYNGSSWTAGTNIFNNNANVGIGFTNPGSKLTVSGGLSIGTTSATSTYLSKKAPDGGAIFEGSVGIGTTNPAYKLQVAGTLGVGSTAIFSSIVGIGTTAPTYNLDVAGTGRFASAINGGTGVSQGILYLNPASLSSSPLVQWSAASAWNQGGFSGQFMAAIGDVDGDGYPDLAENGRYCCGGTGVFFYKNTGTHATPVWTQNSAWDITAVNGGSANSFTGYATFADLNGDGRVDVFLGGSVGDIEGVYAKSNTGSDGPRWTDQASWVTNLPNSGFNAPALGSLDSGTDSLVDLMIGKSDGSVVAYRNTGNSSAPAWTATQAWNLPAVSGKSNAVPSLADLDGDGLTDMLVAFSDGTIKAYKNTGTNIAPAWTETSAWAPAGSPGTSVSLADINNDQVYDMMVYNSGAKGYQNTGSGSVNIINNNTILGIANNGTELMRVNGLGSMFLTASGSVTASTITQNGNGKIFEAANSLGTVFTILNSGYVGIGTTSPTALLTLAASNTSRASLNILAGTAPSSPNAGDIWYDGSNLYFRNGGTSTNITAGLVGAGTVTGQTLYYNGSNWATSNNIFNNGTNVGIGTTAPGSYALNVAGTTYLGGNTTVAGNLLPSADATYSLGDNTHRWTDAFLSSTSLHIGSSTSDEGVITYDTTNNRLNLGIATSAPAITVASNGNVGIGTTNPTYGLQIAGNVGIGGTAFLAGGIVFGSGDGGTPTDTTIRGAAAAGNNTSGANMFFDASNGTGLGGSGSLIFRTAPGVDTAIAFDAMSHTNITNNTNPFSWSHTVTADAAKQNKILIVGISAQNGTSVSSVKIGSAPGVNLTRLGSINVNSKLNIEVWYLKDATLPTGTNTITVTMASGTYVMATALSYYNVDQANTFGTAATNYHDGGCCGGSTTITNDVTSVTGDRVLDFVGTANDVPGTPAPYAGQTMVDHQENSNFESLATSWKTATSASTNMSWTVNSVRVWGSIGVALKSLTNNSPDNMAERMRITNAGLLGIGTTSPGSKLTVSGGLGVGTTSPTSLYLSAAAPDGGAIFEGNVGIGTTTPTAKLEVAGTAWLRGGTAPLSGLFVNNSGYVGIGLTNPAALLTLAGSSTTRASLNIASGIAPSSPNIGDMWFDGTHLYFRKDGSTSQDLLAGMPSGSFNGQTLRYNGSAWIADSNIFNNGTNVGIGTTNPGYTLQVAGTIGIGSTAYFASSVGIGTTNPQAGLHVASTTSIFGVGEGGTPTDTYIRGAQAAGNNANGANMYFDASNGTGGGGSGSLIFRTAPGSDTTFGMDSSVGTTHAFLNWGSSLSWSHTVNAAYSNKVLIVAVALHNGGGISSIKYGGTSMTLLGSKSDGNGTMAVYYLKDASLPTGSNNVAITLSGSNYALGIAQTYYNVDQSTTFGAVGSNNYVGDCCTFNATPTVNVTGAINDQIINFITASSFNFGTPTPGTGQTKLYDEENSQVNIAASTKVATAATTTMNWTLSSSTVNNWRSVGFAMKPLTNNNPDQMAERFRITKTGLIGIGTSNPLYSLDVIASGTGPVARFNNANNTGCTIADGGTISCTSDINLKKNVTDTNYGLDTIMSLRPVEFNWNSESDQTTKTLGFIAQEVEGVVPSLVSTNASGYKELNTIGMVPILAKAIQEQQRKIATVDNQILNTNGTLNNLQLLINNDKVELTDEIRRSNDQMLAIQTQLTDKNLSITDQVTMLGRSVSVITDNQNKLAGQITEFLTRMNQDESRIITLENQMDLLETKNQAVIDFAKALETDRLVYLDETGGLNLLNGQLEADRVTAGEFTLKVKENQDPLFGTATIKTGENNTTITNSNVRETSLINITLKSDPGPSIPYISSQSNGQFTLKVKENTASDIIINWWIMQTSVSSQSSENITDNSTQNNDLETETSPETPSEDTSIETTTQN